MFAQQLLTLYALKTVAIDGPPYSFGSKRVRIILELNENEAPVSAILSIGGEDCVGGCSAAGKGIEHQRVRLCS